VKSQFKFVKLME